MQTIPTVGYGDVTPEHTSGRIIATFVMLWGIAFLSILTAMITSTFVARAAREHERSSRGRDGDPDDPSRSWTRSTRVSTGSRHCSSKTGRDGGAGHRPTRSGLRSVLFELRVVGRVADRDRQAESADHLPGGRHHPRGADYRRDRGEHVLGGSASIPISVAMPRFIR